MKANIVLDIKMDTKQLSVPMKVLLLTPGSFLAPYLIPSIPLNESPRVRKDTPHVAKKKSFAVILPLVTNHRNSRGSTQPPNSDRGANTNFPCTLGGVKDV
eukprot:TRINITY_DN2171_c0_g1_i11.p2 TRINITY_DN2171_c0_g1~~TRINITY_DN2171_c0_g1_i11.p2  ORF type:complete len:101 (-),score=17.74 TRINITY_DN2171_c0_g1_i11:410-712(-)